MRYPPAQPVARVGILMAVWLAAATPRIEAATLHVDSADVDAENSATCGSQATPCLDVQQAVNNASSGDTLLVATGTYTYVGSLEPADCSQTTGVVCIVDKELTLEGGFASGVWTDPDPVANLTVIDGLNSRRGVLVTRRHLGSPPTSLVMSGFTVTRGLADSSPTDGSDAFGGGLNAVLTDFVVLRDMIFSLNVARGADNDPAGGRGGGGGAAIRGDPALRFTATLERVTFDQNLAMGGGGNVRGGIGVGGGLLSNFGTSLTATDLTFTNNRAEGADSTGIGLSGGFRADSLGGGIAILAIPQTAFTDITAHDNESMGGDASGTGGNGGAAFAGAIYLESTVGTVRDSDLRGNEALGGNALNGTPGQQATGGLAAGGAIMTFDSEVTLDEVQVIDNLAESGDGPASASNGVRGQAGGGGAYLERAGIAAGAQLGPFSILNSVFADNSVELGSGSGASGGGGGLFALGSSGTVTHTTFAQNTFNSLLLAGLGTVAVNNGAQVAGIDIDYSIFSDHTSQNLPTVHVIAGSTIDFLSRRSLFANNNMNTGGTGTITGDGNLLTAASADYVSPGSPSFDYHLAIGSAAIGEATGSAQATDFDGQMRSGVRDLGADEFCTAVEDDLVVPDQTVTGGADEEACNTLTAAAYIVGSTGVATFTVGILATLENGFTVENGGTFTVVNALP